MINSRISMKSFLLGFLFTVFVFSPAHAQDYDKVRIKTIKIERK